VLNAQYYSVTLHIITNIWFKVLACLATSFLRRLTDELHLPVYALMDGDPYGLDILSVYRFGSLVHTFQLLHKIINRVTYEDLRCMTDKEITFLHSNVKDSEAE
jgi:DNA topoisomerase VI subunit A